MSSASAAPERGEHLDEHGHARPDRPGRRGRRRAARARRGARRRRAGRRVRSRTARRRRPGARRCRPRPRAGRAGASCAGCSPRPPAGWRWPARAVEPGPLEVAGRQERVGHGLADPQPVQHLADHPAPGLDRREPAGHDRLGHRAAQPLVADVTGDLLDDVDLELAVRAPRGQADVHDAALVEGGGEADGRQALDHHARLDVRAQQRADAVRPHPDRPLLRRELAAGVDRAGVDDEPGAGLPQQVDEAGHGAVDAVGVTTPLEADRRLGAQSQPGGRLRHDDRVEPGHLEGDGRRGVADLGVRATHDAGDADGAILGVADQQVVGDERALHPVEREHGLAGDGPPDAEASAAERVEVVGVVGLVELQHHVVRHVDHVVDGAHAGPGQPLGHQRGRRADLDAGQDDGDEASAPVGVEDLDGERRGPDRRPSASTRAGGGARRGAPRGHGPRPGARTRRAGCG